MYPKVVGLTNVLVNTIVVKAVVIVKGMVIIGARYIIEVVARSLVEVVTGLPVYILPV